MIELGKYNDLKFISETAEGIQLADEAGQEILMPSKYCPQGAKTGDIIKVFVHNNNEGKLVATTQKPKLILGEFCLLQVKAIADGVGAFMPWGIDKDLMIPFREQKQKMEEGRWYIVYLDIDLETDRLYGSSRIERFLQNEIISVSENQLVEVLVWKKTDLGFSVIVNNIHQGLIFDNEIFSELNVGDKMTGYVKNIREDNKIDISLQATGYNNFNDANAEAVFKALELNNGYLHFTDKSSPDEIYSFFGISKKAFKKALGALYKMRKIEITPDGIKII